ncbi:efflux transporter outer membrane subunit [Novosphingobium sp. KCTC 2891]|uniref:efflux transporter outer membrane subunit n=1 Tax=Novosphingobium sp. KCTC 2891 TaxID=2989730 RepID=UPI002223B455|nr:efflux transporter outer membrane subunit [Novosphingobium sp. KCTC 2891]MCW1381626.1 efflux transporter outer membrane subunit [Novosphingobium sp. KCTC 2891]
MNRLRPGKRSGLLWILPALLSGCAAVPDLGARPQLRSADSVAATSLAGDADAAFPADTWWRDYGDAQLTALVEEAIAGSPTLAAAEARARRAEGYAKSAGAALLPSLSASGQAAESKQSYNNGIPALFVPHGWNDTGRASLDLSYEIDFFGRNRAALRAATAERTAAAIEARAARLALATSVAATYADLGRYTAEREVRVSALKLREETAALVRRRVANGLDTKAEQRQAEAAVPVARADLAAADEAITLTRNALAALLGAGPDRGATITPPTSLVPPAALPSRLSLDLVGRRADIAAARARAEAAGARIDVARAAFYPNVNLLAFVGVQSLGIGNLTASGSDIGQAGAAISLPIFEGGRLSGNYRQARADYDEAVAQYDATLVRAVREAADAAASQRSVTQQLAAAREAVAASEEAYGVARRRYEGGLSPYLAVLSAEDALLASRRLLAGLQARALSVNVELIRALGGGFQPA